MLEPLWQQLVAKEAEAREVAAWPGETSDDAVFDWVAADEDDRDRRRRTFRCQCRRGAARRYDRIDLAADEIGGQCGQPIVTALGPAVFGRQILPLNIASLGQALVERGNDGRRFAGRSAAEE